jgi:hypothetical protein
MEIEEFVKRRADAAEEFNLHEGRSDGVEIAGSLAGGLTILRDTLYKRLHEDVQRLMGEDSILAPLSEEKTERLVKIEIELYQVAVSAAAVHRGDYADGGPEWFWQWLSRLRLGPSQPDDTVTKRVECYLAKTPNQRRLTFTDVMARALPESRRAPLVLFRLMPLAVEIVTALAFGDSPQATEVRQHQVALLPAISDCDQCRSKLLENGEQCPECGNPLWLFDWLTSVD